MRLRIQTFSPLPELKAWFIPDILDAQENVLDLKELLCKNVSQLRDHRILGKDLVLLLEGFELLNESPVAAVRDGDLIFVKLKPRIIKEDVDMGSESVVSNPRKRKRNSSEQNGTLQTTAIRKLPALCASSVEGNSDTESTSSASSASSESSSSATSSSSSAVSTSEPTLHPKGSVPKKVTKPRRPLKRGPHITHVPPGLGKPSTHSRNKRRKKKREYEKLATAVLPVAASLPPEESAALPRGISEVNNLPLGSSGTTAGIDPTPPQRVAEGPTAASHNQNHTAESNGSSSKYVYITPDQVVMGSLRNKNKKKGFKQSMAGAIPKKIIFSDQGGQDSAPASNEAKDRHNHFNPQGGPTAVLPRLIPPSELQELGMLPPNVFVTSVDVEEGMWPDSYHHSTSSTKKKKRGKGKARDEDYYYDGGEGYYEIDQGADEGLAYEGAEAGEANATNDMIDWAKAEKQWDASLKVEKPEQLEVGVLVGWKTLAINPQTFTPEMLLFLARVLAVDQEDSSVKICVRPRSASGAALAFGMGVSGEGEMDVEEQVSWSNVIDAEWRLVCL